MLNAQTDCGAKGDGKADDTAALAKFFASKDTGYLPGGTYLISEPLSVLHGTRKVFGDGKYRSIIKPRRDFATLLKISPEVEYFTLEAVSLQTTHTQAAAVRLPAIKKGEKWFFPTVIRFSDVLFEGDCRGPLVLSNGQCVDFDRCTFNLRDGNTWGIEFDRWNENSGVSDCRFGGAGQGVKTSNRGRPGTDNVEGLRIVNCYMYNCGPLNVDLTCCNTALIAGTLLDQAVYANLKIGTGTSGVMVSGCWLGVRGVHQKSAECQELSEKPDRNVVFTSDAGAKHSFSSVFFCNANHPILFADKAIDEGMRQHQVQLGACQYG